MPLLLLLSACAGALRPTMTPDAVLTYRTSDGWINDLRHYPGDGPTVLLVHGMAANHYNFDFRPEVSLASYLNAAGWDVWVPELRGDPGSAPPPGADAAQVTFDDLALRDLPAAVDAVLAATGDDQLYWVGHSMGGILLYTALSAYPERVAGGVAISSPVAFEHPLRIYKTAQGAGFLVRGEGVLPMKGLGRLAVDLGVARSLEARVSTRDSMSPDMLRGLALHVLHPVPKPLARQALTWLEAGAVVDLAGQPLVRPGAEVPLLVMAGPLDGIVPEPDVAAACDVFPRCTYTQLSVAQGFSHDYGHVDPVVGRMAQVEVFPRVLRFLTGIEAARAAGATADAVPR
jgi:pimeloyl-ACP methyl ester carboxylesterase